MSETFDVPNLDAMEADELIALEKVFNRLGAIAGYTAMAKRLRLSGDIEHATQAERCAEVQYQKLPHWAKW